MNKLSPYKYKAQPDIKSASLQIHLEKEETGRWEREVEERR